MFDRCSGGEMRDGFELKCLNDELAELQAKLDENLG